MSQAVSAAAPSSAAPVVDAKLIVPFVNSVREVFKTMVGVEVTIERPKVKAGAEATYDICGIIGFSGDVSGSVVVSFSDVAAMKLVESFAGSALDRDTPDFADAIGELANMIAGGAKKDLGAQASISVPSVVIGKGHRIAGMSGLPCLLIPCKSPHGEFVVEVCIKRAESVPAAAAA